MIIIIMADGQHWVQRETADKDALNDEKYLDKS